jgi:cold shock CspA family protein
LIGPKGFGFIKAEDGVEYFFHKEDFLGNFDELVYQSEMGAKVEVIFNSTPSQKGPRAANVSVVE